MRYFFKIFLWCTALWLAVSAVGPVVARAEADAVAHGAEQEKPVIFLKKTERLNESRILARGVRGFRGLLPHYGLPEYGTSAGVGATGTGAAGSSLRGSSSAASLGSSAGAGAVLRTNVLCDEMAGAAISQEKGVWTSMNMDLKMPNWVAWDLNLAASGADRDPFMAKMPAGTVRLPQHLWRMILDECYRFAFDQALSPVTIVCGPLVSASASSTEPVPATSASATTPGSATASNPANSSVASAPSGASTAASASASAYAGPVPYEFFVVVCKKVRGGLGWQSMGFLLPNTANLPISGGLFKYSVSVNMVEYKTGFDFFKRLPSHLEELIEEMTTYELFCPYIEDENYLDDPFESIDFRELMNDSLEDIRDSY